MAITPVNPSTGLPNSNPAYFPAFTPTWVVNSSFPPIGQGNFGFAPVVVAVQRLPTVRVPPYTVSPSPAPPVNRGTFATWTAVVADIDADGVDPNDQFTVQTSGPLPMGVWTFIGTAVEPPDEYTFNAADWEQAVAPLKLPMTEPTTTGSPAPKEPAHKVRRHKR
jgi:hypothetical protein